MEQRKTRCFNMPRAFLTTDTDEYMIMVLKGKLTDLLISLQLSLYGPYASKDARGRTILYVRLLKSLYGLMRSALLFYRKFRGELEAFEFVVNEYDPCVANLTTAA